MENETELNYKIWLEKNGETILGKGGAYLLNLIDQFRDLGKAAKEMNCSYKHAWNILRKIKQRYEESAVITYKGGKGGGGGIKLSPLGKKLLRRYNRFNELIQDFINNPELWESYGLKIDLKNILLGNIEKIEKDEEVCKLKIKLEPNKILKSIISTESVEDLNLFNEKKVSIIIKATEIQISKVN